MDSRIERRYTGATDEERRAAYREDWVEADARNFVPVGERLETDASGATILVVTYEDQGKPVVAPPPPPTTSAAPVPPPPPSGTTPTWGAPSASSAPPPAGPRTTPSRFGLRKPALIAVGVMFGGIVVSSMAGESSPLGWLGNFGGVLALGALFGLGAIRIWRLQSWATWARVAVAGLLVFLAVSSIPAALSGPSDRSSRAALTAESPTPSPTPTPTLAATPSPTAEPTVEPTPSPSPTPSPTPEVTDASSPSAVASASPSPSPSPSATPAPAPVALAFAITSPANGASVVTDTVTVTGTGPAGARVVQDISLLPDGTTYVGADGTWSMTVDLYDGDNELKFRLGDDAATATTLTVSYADPALAEDPETPLASDPFEAITKKGRGSKIVRFRIPADQAAIAQITERGTSNFAVWTIDANGSKNELLVNEIGSYRGTRLFDTQSHSVAFKVISNGTWKIVIRPVTQARKWNPSTVAKGSGDMVLRLVPGSSGFQMVRFIHKGRSNFAVWAYSPDGADLLVNDIGRYRGEDLLPDGTLLMELIASGTWSITPQ